MKRLFELISSGILSETTAVNLFLVALAIGIVLLWLILRLRRGGRPALGILQRYVLAETFGPIMLSFLTLTFFLLVQAMFGLVALVLRHGSLGLASQLVLMSLPDICSLTVPVSILLGALMGVGRLASGNEILACHVGGVHLGRIFWPLIAICGLASVLMIAVNYEYAPGMYGKRGELATQLTTEAFSSLPAGVLNDISKKFKTAGGNEMAMFFRERNKETGHLEHVRLIVAIPGKSRAQMPKEMSASEGADNSLTLKDAKSLMKKKEGVSKMLVCAERSQIQTDSENNSVNIVLYDAHSYDLGGDLSESVYQFKKLSYPLYSDLLFKKDRSTKEYTVADIIDAAWLDPQGAPWKDFSEEKKQRKRRKLLAALARKTAIPLACLTFVMLAIPLAILVKPSGKSASVAICFGLILLNYWVIEMGGALAEDGVAIGFFVIFLPNLLMGIGGLALFRRAVRL